MTREFLLHIGRHKTGTTAIQRFAHGNSTALAQCGIVYPTAPDQAASHRHLATNMVNYQRMKWGKIHELGFFSFLGQDSVPADPKAAIESFFRNLPAGDERILLSNEGFCNVFPVILREFAPPGRTRIIVYLREQLSYFLSAYAQAVRARKLCVDIEEFLEPKLLNYMTFISGFAQAFGQEQITPRIYERRRFEAGDVRKDFLQVLHLKGEGFQYENVDPNPSIGGPLLAFKLALNRVSTWEERRLFLATYKGLARLALEYPRFRSRPRLSPEVAKQVRARHRESNDQFFATFFTPGDYFEIKEEQGDTSSEFIVGSHDLEIIFDTFRKQDPVFVDEHCRAVKNALRC